MKKSAFTAILAIASASVMASTRAFADVSPAQFTGRYVASGCTTDSQAIIASGEMFPFSGDTVLIDSNTSDSLNVTYGSSESRVGGFSLSLGNPSVACGPGAQKEECEQHAAVSSGSSLVETDTQVKHKFFGGYAPIPGGEVDTFTLTLGADGSISLSASFANLVLGGQTTNLSYSCRLTAAAAN